MMAEVEIEAAPAVLVVCRAAPRPEAEGEAVVSKESRLRRWPPGGMPLTSGSARGWRHRITQQDVLVAVGRGIQQKDNLELAEGLAGVLGGAVAPRGPLSTRAGCRPHGRWASRA